MGGEQVHHQPAPAEAQQDQAVVPEAPAQPTAEELQAETDRLLDEIDGILEANAEDFVNTFQQRNGE